MTAPVRPALTHKYVFIHLAYLQNLNCKYNDIFLGKWYIADCKYQKGVYP